MKFLCLVYIDSDKLETNPPEECLSYAEELRQSGYRVSAEALQCGPADADVMQVRHGKVTTTDGPFAETKEQLAGYYVVEVPDLDEAIRLIRGIPCAPAGRIEIRPIHELGAS